MTDRKAILKEMCASIENADLTKDYEVYSTKEFIVDYAKDVTDALDVLIGIKADEWMLSKMAKAAISVIEQRVEIESKINTDLVSAAAKFVHAHAVSTAVKTKWALSIHRNEGYWSAGIAVADDADTGEIPVMVLTWRLCKEKKGD